MVKKSLIAKLIFGTSIAISCGFVGVVGLSAVGLISLLANGETHYCEFVNYDNSYLYSCKVIDGETATYKGTTPTKPSTDKYTYVFDGWDKQLTNVRDNTTFTALYDERENSFKVTFVNYDGSVLFVADVEYDGTAVYGGVVPKKPSSERLTYTFSGWDKPLTHIIETTTITAQY